MTATAFVLMLVVTAMVGPTKGQIRVDHRTYPSLDQCMAAGKQFSSAPGGPMVEWGCRPADGTKE